MATVCGGISADIERDCDALPVGGVKSVIRVINLSDIAAVTYQVANPLIITAIELVDGAQAYKYEVFKRGHKPRFTLVKGDFADRYRHEVETSIQVWDNATKAQVEGLFSGEVVVIVENLQATGDARFEIYGYSNGLTVADGATRNLNENDGVLTYTLASDDLALEAKMPYTFAVFATNVYSYSQTLAALIALETPAA
jgi:hypothetical protein